MRGEPQDVSDHVHRVSSVEGSSDQDGGIRAMERWRGVCGDSHHCPPPAVGSLSDQVLLDLPRQASSTSAFHIPGDLVRKQSLSS